MLLGLISLMLSQTARWISEICVPSSLFSSRFYMCSKDDFSVGGESGESHPLNQTDFASTVFGVHPHGCDEVRVDLEVLKLSLFCLVNWKLD